jgi:hypothetical protein
MPPGFPPSGGGTPRRVRRGEPTGLVTRGPGAKGGNSSPQHIPAPRQKSSPENSPGCLPTATHHVKSGALGFPGIVDFSRPVDYNLSLILVAMPPGGPWLEPKMPRFRDGLESLH